MKKAACMVFSLLMILSLLSCSAKPSTSTQASGSKAAEADINWPTKPITILVPWSAGGGSDLCVRTLVPYLEDELGTSITVVNKTGANGWIAWNELAKAAPDGYTMAQFNIPAFYAGYLDPQQNRKENLESFRTIANQISDWGTMVVKKGDKRFSSAKDLVEYAKTHELLAGDAGKGSNKHMVTESLKKAIPGLKLVPVHQSGWNDNYAALLGGHIDVAWGSVGETLSAYKSGEVDILCVFAPKRSEVLPDVPTYNELKLSSEVLSPSDRGFFMPAGVDEKVYAKISKAFEKAIQNSEHIQKMKDMGMVVNYIGGDEYAAYAKKCEQDVAAMADVMGWK